MNYVGSGPSNGPKDVLTDDAAVALVADLGACLQDIEVNSRYLGEFSFTLVLYDKAPVALKRSVAECFKIFAQHDAQLLQERPNQLNAWLAVVPGNASFNLRRLWLTSTNYADLSFIFSIRTRERQ